MKKLLSILLLSFSLNIFAIDSYFRIGGTTSSSSLNKNNTYKDFSPSFGFEITQNFLIGDLGMGITYNKGTTDLNIDTTPIYALARFNIFPLFFKPYFVIKLGYIAHSEGNKYNLEGSEYYGLGLGANFSSLQAEILYSETKFDHKDLEQISLIFGFKIF